MSQQFTGLRGPVPQTIRVKFTIAANAAAGTEFIGDVTTDPALSSVQTLTVPANEVWHVVDIYAESSGDVGADGYVDLMVNELRQNLRFGPLGQTLKTLLRPLTLRSAIILDRLSRVNFLFKIRAAQGASGTTTTITVEIVRIPVA